MQPVRLFRILLPIALVGFIVVMALTLTAHAPRRTVPTDVSTEHAARMEGFRFIDLVGGRRRLLVEARVGRVEDRGAFEIEQVERFEVDREGQGPLILTATRGAGTGTQGKRLVRLDGGVTLRDDDGFEVEIPSVEVDQVKGYVRSLGIVRLKNASWSGTAASVVYDLNGGPTDIRGLQLDGRDGGHLAAESGSMSPGSRSLVLNGDVEASQGGATVHADRVVIARGEDGQLESVTATPEVTGQASFGGGPAGFVAREAHAVWDRSGRLASFRLSGNAQVRHVRGTLAADRIEASALETVGDFAVQAETQVTGSGTMAKGTGSLSCDVLHATLDSKGTVRDGVASGNVRFDGDGTAGEAAEAHFTSLAPDGTVTLRASDDRRARISSGRTRIVANTIVSDLRGLKLRAEGRVESTLLPEQGARQVKASPMFKSSEAVHFVSMTLDSANSGAHLAFHGDVRGWQGERTLSAEDVELSQEGEIMNARGHVSTRMPREATRAAIEADYIQVGADRLAYRGAAHVAQYDGSVRVRQAEGWLETPLLVATLADGGPGLREIQAQQGVRFEYRAPGERGVPKTATGDGDRAIYDTAARILHVYGDKSPATVRSTGPNGGTTVGRVLRYDLDSGALEVESGERDRATIRTLKN